MRAEFNIFLVTAIVVCFAIGITNADVRAPQGVAAGIEKPLRIAPRPGNGRNSEGDVIRLKDGRLMLVYTKFVGKSDHATAELVARYSADEGQTWTRDDVPVVARKDGEANLMSVSLLRLKDGRIALFYVQQFTTSPRKSLIPLWLDSILCGLKPYVCGSRITPRQFLRAHLPHANAIVGGEIATDG